MILLLYTILLALALAIIFLGHFTDVPVYTLCGLAFLFLLSIFMMNGEVEYVSGSTVSYTYGTDICSENCTQPKPLSSTTTRESLSSFDATAGDVLGLSLHHIIGFWMAVMSVLGFAVVIADMRNPRGMKQ